MKVGAVAGGSIGRVNRSKWRRNYRFPTLDVTSSTVIRLSRMLESNKGASLSVDSHEDTGIRINFTVCCSIPMGPQFSDRIRIIQGGFWKEVLAISMSFKFAPNGVESDERNAFTKIARLFFSMVGQSVVYVILNSTLTYLSTCGILW